MTKDEAMDLALEALDIAQGLLADAKSYHQPKMLAAYTAIKQARALDKKAENARELGLDYEPADGTQVSKVWWDGEKLMAKPIPLVDFYQPMQDSTCNETLRAQGKAYPRTCRKCGKGPCIGAPKPPPAQPAPVQSCYCPNCEAMGKELAALKAQPAPVQEPVAYRFKARADDLRSAWRYVSKKQHVPHGWPYQSLGITGETKWTNNN
jgi:hypothetical protein